LAEEEIPMTEQEQIQLIKALADILNANDEFRRQMPDGWEGDPLQDACISARALLDVIDTPRTAPPGCTNCHNEADCSHIAVCRGLYFG
jgi:hypothetical protein